jgi:hypothetical protein
MTEDQLEQEALSWLIGLVRAGIGSCHLSASIS